jgi:hypothetical protein
MRLHLITGLLVTLGFTAMVLNLATDPLLLAPQLDGKEILETVSNLSETSTVAESNYRALFYPKVLGLLFGDTPEPWQVMLLGICLHLFNSAAVFCLARQWTPLPTVALLAALLVLLNPVLVFYALQPLDMTLGIALLLGALVLSLHEKTARLAPLAATLACLAVLTRPQFIVLLPILPFIPLVMGREKALPRSLMFAGTAILVLSVLSIVNYQKSGSASILPWQGAYNLWAANKPGANGLYFQQTLDVSDRAGNENPTKTESIRLYAAAHPDESPPFAIDAMSAYWRGRFVEYALSNPVELLKLWSFKAYAVLNSFEQYNNVTFAFHKERIPALRFNPLHWGVLLIFGGLGLAHLLRTQPRSAWAILLLTSVYAGTLILFYASARFRLPLIPFLSILAALSIPWIKDLLQTKQRRLLSAGLILMTAVVTYSNVSGIRDKRTFVQDRLLLANANADLGRDRQAAEWARAVLAEQPSRNEALRVYAMSYLNLALTGSSEIELLGSWEDQAQWVRQRPPTDPAQDAALGLFYWKWGETEKALTLWRMIMQSQPHPLAQAALEASGTSRTAAAPPDLVAGIRSLMQKEGP